MMETINIQQNTPEWLAHRAQHFNASDAPAMMGCSAYATRTQFMHKLHTGLSEAVSPATQQRFDEGHRIEGLARVLAEAILGKDLYPMVGVKGKYSASFDGLTMDERIDFEHKTLNKELRTVMQGDFTGADLPLMYRVQMEHQLMVADADECLFMASEWDGDELIEERHCTYYPDAELRAQIIAGWEQFEIDMTSFTPTEKIVPAVSKPMLMLPAVSIQINGSLALVDNLEVFGAALTDYIQKINKTPQTDQDFADLDGNLKTLKKAEDALNAAEDNAMAQTSSIDSMRKQVELYRDMARTNRLIVEKLFKAEKENRKLAIVMAGKAEFEAHVTALNESVGANYMPPIHVDFGAAVRGLKSIDSMANAVATLLAKSKIQANGFCADIRRNLSTLRVKTEGYAFLFADAAQMVLKDPEDMMAVVTARINAHKIKEAAKAEEARIADEARIEAQTLRIREEERQKAEAAAKATIDAAAAEVAKAEAEKVAAQVVILPVAAEAVAPRVIAVPIAPTRSFSQPKKATRPTDVQIVEVLALHYRVHESKVIEWLTAMDIDAVNKNLQTEFA